MGEKKQNEKSKSIKKDYETIKKLYGEDMARYCRSNLSTIFEIEGKMPALLQKYFAPVKGLYDELKEERNMLDRFNSTMMAEYMEEYLSDVYSSGEIETPEELLAKAGYDLFKCESVEDIMKFEELYEDEEAICTFRSPKERLDICHIFWAVKKDVKNIKREDFEFPERDDEYGTSVISIQFTKEEGNRLSIKNRYNHNVDNCDATFSNCLDNIVKGLTYSFEKHKGIQQEFQKSSLSLGGFIQGEDGVRYAFNIMDGDVYYCNNNVVVEGVFGWDSDDFKVHHYDKARYEVFDNFILDIKEKRIFSHQGAFTIQDETFSALNIEKCSVEAIKGTTDRLIKILASGKVNIELKVDGRGRLVEFYGTGLERVGDFFLKNSKYLEKFDAPDLKVVGDHFLESATRLKEASMPKLEETGNHFLSWAYRMESIDVPNLKKVGEGFLYKCEKLKKFNAPMLEESGTKFLHQCHSLIEFSAPRLTEFKDESLTGCYFLKSLDAPNIKTMGKDVLHFSRSLKTLDLPHLTTMGDNALGECGEVETINLPSLRSIGNNLFLDVKQLREASFPALENVCTGFFYSANALKKFYAPKITKLEDNCLVFAWSLEEFNAENLEEVGESCLSKVPMLSSLDAPNLKRAGAGFLRDNGLQEVVFPLLQNVGDSFMNDSKELESIALPSLEKVPHFAFQHTPKIRKIYLPNAKTLVGHNFEEEIDEKIESINMTNLVSVGYRCFHSIATEKLNFPNLEYIDSGCFEYVHVNTVELPSLVEVGNDCFRSCWNPIEKFSAEKLERVGKRFLNHSDAINLFAPKLQELGEEALTVNMDTNLASWVLPDEVKRELTRRKKLLVKAEKIDKRNFAINEAKIKEAKSMPNVRAKGTRAKENFAFGGKDKPKNTATQTSQESKNTNTEIPQNAGNTYRNNLFNRLFGRETKPNKEFIEDNAQRLFQQNLRNEIGNQLSEDLGPTKKEEPKKPQSKQQTKHHEEELGK